MFGKKKEINAKSNIEQAVKVQTIPADFYGGVNPVVKFKRVEKEITIDSKSELTASEKKLLDKSMVVGSGSWWHPANFLTNKKYAIIFGVGFFIIILLGVSGYYYFQNLRKPQVFVPAQPKIIFPTTTEQTSQVKENNIPDVIFSTNTPQASIEASIEFPSFLLGDGPDLDKDNLTDSVEELFGSDPSKPDTDEDSYNDGHEVFYLYNPVGKEPKRMIDSGYVKDYSNTIFGYKIFYPSTWVVGNVDENYRDVLFSTITGENIELRVFDLLPNETFTDWFARSAEGQQNQSLLDFQTKFGEIGKNRTDNLVYYFSDNRNVYVLVYHTTDSNVVNYRSIMVMMARSFRYPGFVPTEVVVPLAQTSTFPIEMPSSADNASVQ